MRLSKMELAGFKSFANPTTISLPEKIIAIVGPNGCGKSNISDALRWVLGVQSAKLLRGKKMDDFIFNGSGGRKPLGMAQVSLTMESGNGAIQYPGLEGSTEITVTRRVYRDGEGEYLINKTPCRLKDITDLFMDIGVGTKILSVIEQGQIEQLISAKPEDRRFIIEEAAGIAKYKDRKETALRKLEQTEGNLLRVKDIMAEVKRQLNSLKRQAGKAERYKKFRQEARELDLAILSSEYQRLAGRLSRISGELHTARQKHDAHLSAFNAAENRLESLRLSLTQASGDISRLSQEIHHLEKEALRAEADIQSAGGSAQALLSEAERLWKENTELNGKLTDLKKEVERKRVEEGALAREAGEKSHRLQSIKTEVDGLAEDHRLAREKLEEERAAYIDLQSAISRERNIVNAVETQRENLSRREARIEAEKSEAASALDRLNTDRKDKETELHELRSGIEALKESRRTLVAEIEEIEVELTEAEDEVASLREEHSSLNARINSLQELVKSYEGYRDGVKTILTGRENGNELEGVRGVIAELLETSPRYEPAIEAVLGEKLQYLVAEDHGQCFKALQYLKSSLGGRSTFIPVNPRAEPVEAAPLLNRQGVIGLARRLVNCSSEYSRVFDHLLGNVLVVEGLDTALSLWKENSIKVTMVTLNGEVVDSAGAVTGGATTDNNGSILHRKRVLREMNETLSKLESRLKTAATIRDGYLSRSELLKERLEQTDERLRAREVEALNCSKELELIQNELRNTSLKLDAANYEEEELARERNGLLTEQQRARAELNHLSGEKYRLERATQELQQKAEALDAAMEERKAAAIREEMELVSVREKHSRCLFEIQGLLEAEEETRLKLQQKNREREEAISKRERALNTVEELKVRLASLEQEKNDCSRALVQKQEEHREAQDRLSDREAELKTLRAGMDESRERLHDLSLQETELKVQAENVLEAARDGYGTDLRNEQRELPGELEECRERLAQLRQTLEKIGDVNMSALSEYEEHKERYDFLLTQHDDLEQSMGDLREAIEKINRTTRVRFREAYQKINANFKDMFTRLFGGGEAELVLTDQSDLLETGVDIVARPPGKRLQNITLLSSGEKALTSLALLFGVFLSKPSPFCLLDEVDAPLDEPNIERFTSVLKELSGQTQFIIITHNRSTMTAAELLYGITMEEEGVSKMLSLRLEDAPAAV